MVDIGRFGSEPNWVYIDCCDECWSKKISCPLVSHQGQEIQKHTVRPQEDSARNPARQLRRVGQPLGVALFAGPFVDAAVIYRVTLIGNIIPIYLFIF